MTMSIDGKFPELRKRLVIEKETVSAHCDKVAALKQEFSHSIRCLDRPQNGTCVTYALGLLNGFFRLCRELQDSGVKPGRAFIEWLLEEGKLRELGSPQVGALMLYFDGETWRHAGVVVGPERVVSKWGEYAVFEHGFAEVPANYGNELKFYEMPEPNEAGGLFFEFGCLELDLKPPEIARLREMTGVSPEES